MEPTSPFDRLRTFLATSPAVPWLLFLALTAVSLGIVGAVAFRTLR